MNFESDFFQGWRDGSAFQSTGCSSRGPQLTSQRSYGSSSFRASDAFLWPLGPRHACSTYTTHTHKMNKIINKTKIFFSVCLIIIV